MTEDEDKPITAIKQARSAPVQSCYCPNCEAMGKELAALKAQTAPVQKPVTFFDWYDNAHWGNEDFKEGCHRAWNAAIKYTAPPAARRQWVGLTDGEYGSMYNTHLRNGGPIQHFTQAIEAQLKEKNT